MTATMYDAVTPSGIPANAAFACYYVDGRYANEAGVRARVPHAFFTPITVFGSRWGRIGDVENGDMSPEGGLRWLADQRRDNPLKLPSLDDYGLYGSGSTWSALGNPAGHGASWLARPDRNPAIPAGFKAKQHTWLPQVDISSCLGTFFPLPPPSPPDPHHYDRYPLGPFRVSRNLVLNERATVQEYDRLFTAYGPHIAARSPRMKVLRAHIKLLRDRVWTVAHRGGQGQWGASPDWVSYWRGWRWQKLNDRLHGGVKL